MIAALRSLGRSRNFLLEWTTRTLRARYQQSLMGWLWAVLQPAAQALMLGIVFTYVVPVTTGTTPYLLFVFIGTVAWAFVVSAMADMTNAIVDNMTLVNKVYFAREVLPLGTMLARLIDLALGLVVVGAIGLVTGALHLSPALLALPIVMLVQVLCVTGLGLMCAAGNVFIRDVRSLVQLGTQVWFYASPVLYPTSRVPEWLQPYYVWNPMVGVLDGYRSVLFEGQWPGPTFAASLLVSVVMAGTGYLVFLRLEPRLADVV